jgi:integrase/recombinase XerD
LTILLHIEEVKMAPFAIGEGWQIHDAAGRRKYLSSDERTRFLRTADSLSPRSRALCHVLAYAGCRISEGLALTVHHVDAERLTVTIRTLKRRRLVFRGVPLPQSVIEMLRRLPTDTDGRFWPMHRVTAWRVIKATMRRAGIAGPMACPERLARSDPTSSSRERPSGPTEAPAGRAPFHSLRGACRSDHQGVIGRGGIGNWAHRVKKTQKLIVYALPVDREINRAGPYPLTIQEDEDVNGLVDQRI